MMAQAHDDFSFPSSSSSANTITTDDARVGALRTRKLSVSITGASFGSVVSVHEAKREEGRRRALSQSQSGQSLELQPLSTSFRDEEEGGEDDDSAADFDFQQPQMPPKQSRSRSSTPRQSRPSSDSTGFSSTSNGHAADTKMNGGSFRERAGKHPTSIDDDGDTSRQTDRLMGRNDFSLDFATPTIPAKGEVPENSKGFWELPEQDRKNFLLLVLLYFLQGIPMGLAGGSVPFLLKSHLSYGQIGVYSLASYPYSLKLLWSPIVDAVWSSKVGRRKSWILPIQALSGLGMLWLGSRAEQMMVQAGENEGAGVWNFTGWWFSLVFMCATQDIAVDGKSCTEIEW